MTSTIELIGKVGIVLTVEHEGKARTYAFGDKTDLSTITAKYTELMGMLNV